MCEWWYGGYTEEAELSFFIKGRGARDAFGRRACRYSYGRDVKSIFAVRYQESGGQRTGINGPFCISALEQCGTGYFLGYTSVIR